MPEQANIVYVHALDPEPTLATIPATLEGLKEFLKYDIPQKECYGLLKLEVKDLEMDLVAIYNRSDISYHSEKGLGVRILDKRQSPVVFVKHDGDGKIFSEEGHLNSMTQEEVDEAIEMLGKSIAV